MFVHVVKWQCTNTFESHTNESIHSQSGLPNQQLAMVSRYRQCLLAILRVLIGLSPIPGERLSFAMVSSGTVPTGHLPSLELAVLLEFVLADCEIWGNQEDTSPRNNHFRLANEVKCQILHVTYDFACEYPAAFFDSLKNVAFLPSSGNPSASFYFPLLLMACACEQIRVQGIQFLGLLLFSTPKLKQSFLRMHGFSIMKRLLAKHMASTDTCSALLKLISDSFRPYSPQTEENQVKEANTKTTQAIQPTLNSTSQALAKSDTNVAESNMLNKGSIPSEKQGDREEKNITKTDNCEETPLEQMKVGSESIQDTAALASTASWWNFRRKGNTVGAVIRADVDSYVETETQNKANPIRGSSETSNPKDSTSEVSCATSLTNTAPKLSTSSSSKLNKAEISNLRSTSVSTKPSTQSESVEQVVHPEAIEVLLEVLKCSKGSSHNPAEKLTLHELQKRTFDQLNRLLFIREANVDAFFAMPWLKWLFSYTFGQKQGVAGRKISTDSASGLSDSEDATGYLKQTETGESHSTFRESDPLKRKNWHFPFGGMWNASTGNSSAWTSSAGEDTEAEGVNCEERVKSYYTDSANRLHPSRRYSDPRKRSRSISLDLDDWIHHASFVSTESSESEISAIGDMFPMFTESVLNFIQRLMVFDMRRNWRQPRRILDIFVLTGVDELGVENCTDSQVEFFQLAVIEAVICAWERKPKMPEEDSATTTNILRNLYALVDKIEDRFEYLSVDVAISVINCINVIAFENSTSVRLLMKEFNLFDIRTNMVLYCLRGQFDLVSKLQVLSRFGKFIQY